MPTRLRPYLPAAVDAAFLLVALVAAYNIVFGLAVPADERFLEGRDYALQLQLLLPWWVLTHLALLAAFPLYRGAQRPEVPIAAATGCHFLLWAIINGIISGRESFLQLPQAQMDGEIVVLTIPWGALILYALLSGGLMWGWRQLPRIEGATPAPAGRKRPGDGPLRCLVGDGPAAERLLKHLRGTGSRLPTQVLTRDVAQVGKRFSGIPIVATVEKLPDVIGAHDEAEVLLAPEKRDAAQLRRMLDACQACRGRFLLATRRDEEPLRTIVAEDLFGWAENLDRNAGDVPKPRVRRALVVGAGSIAGRELASQLAALQPEALWLVDHHRDALEEAVAAAATACPQAVLHKALVFPGDANGIGQVLRRARPEAIVYAAGCDSVPLLEEDPGAAVQENVVALAPWVRLAHGLGVESFVLLSTLHAGDPSSVAAATLRLGELVALSRGARSECRFTVLRIPEVAERRDSLVSQLTEQTDGRGTARLSHPDMELSPLPARWVARLALAAIAVKAPTGVLGTAMPTRLKLADAARQLLAARGKRWGKDVQVEYSGLPEGERLRAPAVEGETPFAQVPQLIALEEEPLPSPESLRDTLRTVEWLAEEERPETLLAYLGERVPGYFPSKDVTWRPEVLENAPWAEQEEIMPPAPDLKEQPSPAKAEPVEDLAPPEPEPEPPEEEPQPAPPAKEPEPKPPAEKPAETERLAPAPPGVPNSPKGKESAEADGEKGGAPFEEGDLFAEASPRAPEPETEETGTPTEERKEEETMSPSQEPAKGTCLVLSITKGVEKDTLEMLLDQMQQTVLGEDDKLVCIVDPEDEAKAAKVPVKLVRGSKPNGALMNEALETHPGAGMLVTLNSEVLLKEEALPELRKALADGTPLAYAHFEEDRAGERSTVILHDHEGCPHERFEYGPVIAYHTGAIKEVGGIRDDLNFAWEYDLHLKLMEQKPFKRIKEPLYIHFLQVVEDSTGKKVFSPGGGPLGGFSYVFYPEDVEREVTSVFEEALKRRGAWIDHPTVEVDHSGKKYETMATVVIPILNRMRFISNALDKLLANTYKDFEVVVVDNGSTDGTIEKVKEYEAKDSRVRLVHGKGSTIASALNEGIRAARGKYIGQHDSDDEYDPKCIEKMVAQLESNPKCGLAISYYRLMDEDGEIIEEVNPVTHGGYTRNQILRRDGAGATRWFPKAVLEEFGLYDEEHYGNFGEDYDMVVKTGEKYDVDRVHEVLYYYRRHPDNTDVTRDPEMKYKNKNRARQEALRRRIEINKRLGKAPQKTG